MVRHKLNGAQATARAEMAAHNEEKLSRREEALTRQLNAAVDRYAEALELFDAWKTQGAKDCKGLDAALEGMTELQQIGELRRQIEMRTLGCGWTQFETKWGFFADERQHTLQLLKSMLVSDIVPHEMALARKKRLPTEAAPPQLTKRAMKVLGTLDADAARIEAQSTFNVELLRPKAEAARARREAAGISDSVEARQPEHAPPFDVR